MEKAKKHTNARVAGRRKQTKECSAAEQLCMDNIPMGLNGSDDSSVSDSLEESRSTYASLLFLSNSQIFAEFSLLLTLFFVPAFLVNFRFFLIDVCSFVLRCFRVFELVHGVSHGPYLLNHNLIELHQTRTILGSQNNNADQLTSQFEAKSSRLIAYTS